jgi:hypothetical protein
LVGCKEDLRIRLVQLISRKYAKIRSLAAIACLFHPCFSTRQGRMVAYPALASLIHSHLAGIVHGFADVLSEPMMKIFDWVMY